MISLTDCQIGIIAFACGKSVEQFQAAIDDANEGENERMKEFGYCVCTSQYSPQEYCDNILLRIQQ